MSANPAKLAVANTAPEPLAALSVVPGFSVIEISYLRPDDLDFAGVDIWVSQTQGFDPDATEPTATVSDNSYIVSSLTQGETYYVRLRPFDLFGKTGTNTSAEFAVTTKTGVDITGLSGWAYEIDPVDRAFIEANLAGDAIPSTRIESLAVPKLTGGVINATETITSEGVIRAVDDIDNPVVQVGIGPATFGTTTYLQWALNGGEIIFGIDELGNANYTGNVTLTGDNLWANTRIQVGGDQAGSDYVIIDVNDSGDGVVETYKEFSGQHRLFKALTRTEAGVANSGDLVTLPGYFSAAPKVQVSPNSLPTYDPEYSGQTQTWVCRAEGLTEISDGVWRFNAVSNLELGEGSGTKVVNLTYEGTDSYITTPVSTISNTDNIEVHVSLKSFRGSGNVPTYMLRKVQWRIGYSSSVDGTYEFTSYQTKNIGPTLEYVVDDRDLSLISGTWFIKVEFISSDAGGTFTQGSNEYVYDTAVVTNNGPVEGQELNGLNGLLNLNLPSYTPPSGWEIYSVDYYVQKAYYVQNNSRVSNNNSIGPAYNVYSSGPVLGDYQLNNWQAHSSTSGSYSTTALQGKMESGSIGVARLGLRNGKATITIRRLVFNDSTVTNGFKFNYFNYSLSGGVVITPGVLNWLAVGE